MWTIANITRVLALVAVILLFVADIGLDLLAKDVAKEIYFGLIAVGLGVDIKALRDIILRVLGGKTEGK